MLEHARGDWHIAQIAAAFGGVGFCGVVSTAMRGGRCPDRPGCEYDGATSPLLPERDPIEGPRALSPPEKEGE